GLLFLPATARTDTDLGPLPDLNQFNNQFYSGLGNAVHQPNLNFAPQLGFAWDPGSNGKTVIRGGIGLFYENSVWNNILFDPGARLKQGLFLGFQPDTDPTIIGKAIGQAAPAIIAAQQAYQAQTLAQRPQANG